MKIILYKNNGERKRVDKTPFLILYKEINNCYFKENGSLLTPFIILSANNVNISSCNYCYIENINRYYFINDIIILDNNRVQLQLNIDVLYTYKNSIYSSSIKALVERSETYYDKFIYDDLLPFRNELDISIINPTIVESFTNASLNKYCYVVNALCDFTLTTELNPSNKYGDFPTTTSDDLGYEKSCNTWVLSPNKFFSLMQKIYNNDNLKTFIISAMITPFEFKNDEMDTSEYSIVIGNTTLDDIKCRRLNEKGLTKELWHAKYIMSFDNFMEKDPCSNYKIYIPFVGEVNISSSNLETSATWLIYQFDFINGQSQAVLCKGLSGNPTGNILGVYPCNCLIQLGISSTNALEVKNANISNAMATTLGLISSSLSVLGGAVSMNPIAVGIGAVNGANTLASSINHKLTNYTTGSTATNSPTLSKQLPWKSYIKKESLIPVFNPFANENFKILYGLKCNKCDSLNKFRGFTKVNEVHIEGVGFQDALEEEKRMIENELKTGVIF